MNRKITVLFLAALLLFAACNNPRTPFASSGDEHPFATAPVPPVSPLPPVDPRDAPSELPPPASEPKLETINEPGAAAPKSQEPATVQDESVSTEILPYSSKDTVFDAVKVEAELLRLINLLRLEEGIEPLGLQEQMQVAAGIRSYEALLKFSHTRPNETPYNTVFDESGFEYSGKWHGENLAALSFPAGAFDEKTAALELFEGLKESPGHRENMIRGNFAQIGIGVTVSAVEDEIKIASAQLFASF